MKLNLEQFEGHTPIALSVKWTDNYCCLTHPELGVVRLVKDSGSAHYLEAIAAQHNAAPALLAECKRINALYEKEVANHTITEGLRLNQHNEISAQREQIAELEKIVRLYLASADKSLVGRGKLDLADIDAMARAALAKVRS